jgi:hypothetical protein
MPLITVPDRSVYINETVEYYLILDSQNQSLDKRL